MTAARMQEQIAAAVALIGASVVALERESDCPEALDTLMYAQTMLEGVGKALTSRVQRQALRAAETGVSQ